MEAMESLPRPFVVLHLFVVEIEVENIILGNGSDL